MAQLPNKLKNKIPDRPNAERDQAYYELLFNEMNFPGMDLMEVRYYAEDPETILENQKLFRRMSKDFTKYLGYHYANDLRSAGISEEGLFLIKKGVIPENFTVHLKYPLNYGGKVDFKNMVFMQNHPYHDLIHMYIDHQLINKEDGLYYPPSLYIPAPVGKIYIPLTTFTGSGGKGKHDRSALTGYTQDALKEIALKAMPGR